MLRQGENSQSKVTAVKVKYIMSTILNTLLIYYVDVTTQLQKKIFKSANSI